MKPFDSDFSVSNQKNPLSTPQIPHYTPIPEAIDVFELDTSSRAVLVALLSKCAYAYDRLLRGQRLTVSLDLPSLARLAGLSPRATTGAARKLTEAGLVRQVRQGPRASIWEVRPPVFDLPEDDVERRRSASSVKRRYTVYPAALAGELSPIDAAVLQKILQKSGVGLVTRFLAGEEIWVSTTVETIAKGLRTSEKTVRRSLASLRERGMIESRSSGRAGLTIQVLAGIWGGHPAARLAPKPSGTNVPVRDENAVIFADQLPPFPIIPHEETPSETSGAGVAARRVRLYAVLFAFVLLGSRVTSSGIRARIRRAAAALSLAGADPETVQRESLDLLRRTNHVPSPEAILDRVLTRLADRRFQTARESQFEGAPHPVATAPHEPPAEIDTSLLDRDELAAWRWRDEIAAGAPGSGTFRELLGGLPWEPGYVPRGARQHSPPAIPNPELPLPPAEPVREPERISIAEGLAIVRAKMASRGCSREARQAYPDSGSGGCGTDASETAVSGGD